MAKNRVPIPAAVQTQVLVANRHACCVCQKHRVQLHHIDSNPSNNAVSNIACLCLEHHDMATAQASLTKKLTPTQVRIYKKGWEAKCAEDIYALSRGRFSFFYSMYKNPPRVREALSSLSKDQRVAAVDRVAAAIAAIPAENQIDWLGGKKQNPGNDAWTLSSLRDIKKGLVAPTFLPKVRTHPKDPTYPYDFAVEAGLVAFYGYDIFVQTQVQVLSQARGTVPLEDLYRYTKEEQFDHLAGRLVTFTMGIWGKDLVPPDQADKQPNGQMQGRKTVNGRLYRTVMQLRNMYLFSTTSSVNGNRARVSGIGIFGGAVRDGKEITLTVIPLLIGMGGVPGSDGQFG